MGQRRVTSDRYGHLFPSARAALAESLDATFRSTHKTGTAEIRPKLPNPAITETAQTLKKVTLPATPTGADDGIRTRDPHLGKVMLYQLSHVRVRLTP